MSTYIAGVCPECGRGYTDLAYHRQHQCPKAKHLRNVGCAAVANERSGSSASLPSGAKPDETQAQTVEQIKQMPVVFDARRALYAEASDRCCQTQGFIIGAIETHVDGLIAAVITQLAALRAEPSKPEAQTVEPRTLASYRPQHDDDCEQRINARYYACTCGLDAVLRAESSLQVERKEKEDHGGTSLTEGTSVSVSAAPKLPHDEQYADVGDCACAKCSPLVDTEEIR